MKKPKTKRSEKQFKSSARNYSRGFTLHHWSNSSVEMKNPSPSKKKSYLFYNLTFLIRNSFSLFTVNLWYKVIKIKSGYIKLVYFFACSLKQLMLYVNDSKKHENFKKFKLSTIFHG